MNARTIKLMAALTGLAVLLLTSGCSSMGTKAAKHKVKKVTPGLETKEQKAAKNVKSHVR